MPQEAPQSPRAVLNFAYERQRHVGFVGRVALLAQLDQQLIEGPSQRWVVVTGGPGMGKSAVLAAWLARREAAGEAVPHHFIRRGWANWDDPEALVGSLVAQLEARVPEACELEADARLAPAARLAAALQRVSERALVPRGGRLVLLIDGLDEYDPRPGSLAGDPLGAFLPYALPRGVSVLCASRPRHPYVDSLATRGVLVQIDLDDAHRFAVDNTATVRAFWEQAARELDLDASFIVQAVERAGGNLEHAAMLHRQLAGLPPERRHVEDIPRGLGALIASAWDRIATDPAVVDGLGILCAAREPLTLDELGRVARWTGAAPRHAFVRGAREWLIETRRTSGASEYRLHHDSIRAHVANAIGTDALAGHHLALAERLATWPAPGEASARRYALRHALQHRGEVGAWVDAWRVVADVAFLEAKYREVGVDDAEADVARTAARCRASGDETHGERFADLARALGRESHWLRAAPEATAALVWNRLRRYGWTASELDAQLRVPAAADFLRVRHAATRESPALVRNLEGHTDWVQACAVTPDGRHVVSAADDQTLKVWELGSGLAVATLQGHTAGVTACAVMPDGRHVVSTSWDQTLKVWELGSGRAVVTLVGHTAGVTACAVTPDGRHVVSASDDKTLKVWELGSGRAVATLQGHTNMVTACAVTPDGRHVVSASRDQTLKVWELGSGRAVATLQGHTNMVTACAVTPDGRYVVSASVDHTLKVWELGSGRAVATLDSRTDIVTACAVTPDGRHVVSASRDQMLKVWELGSGREVATLDGHTNTVTACAVTPDGRHVVSASWDQTLKMWELGSGRAVATLAGHTDRVNACAVTPDGRHVVSASADQTLKVWELASGRAVATLAGHIARVTACAVTPDGRYVVSALLDQTLKVWELASRRAVATLDGHTRAVNACEVVPDGRHVVSASDDRTLKVWELASGRPVTTLAGHTEKVMACAVTPDGRHVVSASTDKTLKVWELATGRAVATLAGHTKGVTACAVTPDGRHVVSASRDQMLKVWELESGRAVATLEGHTDVVRACAVTPDGRHLVSASADQTLRVWDLTTYICRIIHRGDAGYLAVACSAATVIAGDASGSVWFLDWPWTDRQGLLRDGDDHAPRRMPPRETESASQRTPMKHTILFLAANPLGTDRLGLDREARAIQVELERSGFRDSFELVTRWAVEPLDLLRELRKLKPAVVHFSGHGSSGVAGARDSATGPRRDVVVENSAVDGAPQHGLFFQGADGRPQLVSAEALETAFDAAGSSVKLVVLSACYSEPQAAALLTRVDCVVGMRGSILEDAARSFAIGFYGGLGERESVAAAYKQGCAAIRLEGLPDADRPQLRTRPGVDAAKLVLASAEQVSRGDAGAAATPQPRQASMNRGSAPRVDIGILTIRDDEFRAVLAAFPDRAGTHKGASREYTLCHADAGDDQRYRIAVSRLIEQGNGEAQDAARDLIDDLSPRLVLVVGIAGAPPSEDVKLGDVVVSTRIHDFTVEARKAGEEPTYSVTGGPIDKALAAFVANLAAREHELGRWTADLPPPPPVAWESEGKLYGPPDWQRALRDKLAYHHGASASPGVPAYATGPIAASDRLVKDPELLIPWLRTARDLRAIEMESAGVYRAVRGRCPMLAIRGISDIVGLKRSDAWTKYACASAAAFTRAFLRTRPVGDPL